MKVLGIAHTAINVTDMDRAVKFYADGNWQCWTHDPDGNRIELMQMGEESIQNKFAKSMSY